MENNRTQHSVLKINRYSFGIALPKWMTRELELEAGERVDLKFDRGKRSIIISKSPLEAELPTEQTPAKADFRTEQAPKNDIRVEAPVVPMPAASISTQTTPMEAGIPAGQAPLEDKFLTGQVETNNFQYDDSDVIPMPEL